MAMTNIGVRTQGLGRYVNPPNTLTIKEEKK